MAEGHDYLALDWVRGEIEDTLNQSQQALEAWVENPEDSSRMRFCQTYLHQVYGTLQMVEFYGASLLAEEMEKLAQALLEDKVAAAQQNDARQTLMQAILQLPPYLDRVQSSRRDLPLVLLPLLNDLRAARGESLMSETSLFKPDIESSARQGQVPPKVAKDESFPALMRKIRQMYQLALLGVLRDQKVSESLGYMAKVLSKMEQVSGEASMSQLWSVANALVEGVSSGAIETGASVKAMLSHIDRVLRDVVIGGAGVLSETPPRELLKNLLYYVAKADSDSPLIRQVREAYRLSEALPTDAMVDEERARLSGPDRAAMGSVVQALSEELEKVKAALEQFVLQEQGDLSILKEQGATLKQVSDTVAVLGLGKPRQLIEEQLEVINAMASGERPVERDLLMDVAGALLYVEATLTGVSSDKQRGGIFAGAPDHVDDARDAVIRESRAGLEEAKDGIVEFIASQWDQQHLEKVPERLTAVRGGLELIGLARPALILRQCVSYVRENLVGEDRVQPDWRSMDTLADAITGVEYYLERLSDDPETSDDVLNLARESVATLGYPIAVADYGEDSIAEDSNADEMALALPDEEPGDDAEAVAPSEPAGAQPAQDEAPASFEEPAAEAFSAEEPVAEQPDSTSADTAENETTPPVSEQQEPSAEQEPSAGQEPAAAQEPSAEQEPDESEDLIDDEIIEIFVEEAGEVLEALNEFFPRWVADKDDEEALIEFRRAFHTLKGSGRMVGASIIGELAWSVENMMNRVIDKTITPTPVLVELVQEVHRRIPVLVEAFSSKQKPPFDVQPLADAADALAGGGSIDTVPDIEAGGVAPIKEDSGTDTDSASDSDSEKDIEMGADAGEPALSDQQIEADGVDVQDEPTLADDQAEQDADAGAHDGEVEEISYALPADADADAEIDSAEHSFSSDSVEEDVDDLEIDLSAFETPTGDESSASDQPADEQAEEISYTALETGDDETSGAELPDFAADDSEEMDPVLLEIFRSEGETNLALVTDWLDRLDQDISEHPVDDSVHRALHTLKGSARMAEIEAVATVAEPAEKLVKELVGNSRPADREIITLLRDTAMVIRYGVEDPLAHRDGLPGAEALLERLAVAHEQLGRGATGPDAHILSVFLSEGMDLIIDAEELLERWAGHPENTAELKPLRDELTLLANSAETAGLSEVSTLSLALGDCYTAIADERLHCSDEFLELAYRGHEALINMMDHLAASQSINAEDELVASLRALLDDGMPPPSPPEPGGDDDESNITGAGDADHAADPAQPDEPTGAATAPQPPQDQDEPEAVASPAPTAEPVSVSDLDPELLEIFLEEAEEILETSSQQLETWRQDGDDGAVALLQRDLHTLKGGARMAGVAPIGDLAHELEFLYEGFSQQGLPADETLFTMLNACHDRLADMVDALRAGNVVQPADDLVRRVQALLGHAPEEDSAEQSPATESQAAAVAPEPVAEEVVPQEPTPVSVEPVAAEEDSDAVPPPPERDTELVEIFLEEADEILEAVTGRLESWMADPDNLIEVQSLQRDLHTLKGGARMAEIPELGDLGHELENLYEGLAQGSLKAEPVLFDLLHRCHDRLAEMVEAVKADQGIRPADHLIKAINEYIANPADFVLPSMAPAASPTPAPTAELTQSPAPAAPAEAPAAEPAEPVTDWLPDDVDPEILEIFLEESSELCELIEETIGAWRETPEAKSQRDELARALHTLKGGARLAGLKQLGDMTHEFETLILNADTDKVPRDAAWFDKLIGWQDKINEMMTAVNAAARAGATAPAAQPQVAEQKQPAAQSEQTTPAVAKQTPAKQEKQPDQQTLREDRQKRQAQPQEMVRVASDLLESLVNLAGETSINRGRVEQGITEFSNYVDEMGNTIERLYEQLRRLDIETEAQIMSNYKQGVEMGEYDEDFDPLEMDQYSELHQITKQLSESASDLLDLKNTLIDRSRDTETLLLQQSRINTELQEKLMRTRMVPFARLVPRLRRIVRQVSGEIGKKVEFEVLNPEGELDRTLLERVVAPLEHMLRNAVDHGVEPPDARVAAGKQETGRVSLELGREGGEVVLTLTDDGKGIDTAAVRKKAVERGLIDDATELSDQEIQQFIFDAGFSTADKVTQISGRGVGMDVVSSEIKQMGGTVSIESTLGKGTRFMVRLPFTLAMNRALMVSVGEDSYAIPLNQIEGIVRISPYELENYFQPDPPPFVYAGQDYDFEYLGNFVHGNLKPTHLDSQITPLPVLLIRSAEHTVAVLVDALVGSREVVVKSVGPQLSTVAGISGATILGDGSVVIILDIHSLIRGAHVQRQHVAMEERRALQAEEMEREAEQAAERAARNPLVMVTDDSVTVRKVTTRLLERAGYEVMTAKDGVDAIATLEDRRPDLMLLDIEMPRMDGFEVATHMRHSERLKDVPIIMITSRTGEKHRDRAFDIGVNSYMGKPFQEKELLQTIQELLMQARETSH